MGKRYASQPDPGRLHAEGPVIQVDIFPPSSVVKLRGGNVDVVHARALIDTGATNTCISPRVATDLKLQAVNQVVVNHAQGQGLANQYVISLTFTGSNILFKDVLVTEANLAATPFDMLVGRDVLSTAILTYDGVKGNFEIDLPGVPADKKSTRPPKKRSATPRKKQRKRIKKR